jgi:hypothetical protein
VIRAVLSSLVALAATPPALGGTGAAFFVSTCSFSHMSTDDPIVWPGRPGYSHNHTFVGNVSTNAFSTLSSLRASGTSCTPSSDTAAYWAPTLYADSRPVAPSNATIYYRRLTTAPVRPFPAGLRMVAGDSHATSAQSTKVTFWNCASIKETFYSVDFRRLPDPSALVSASSTVPRCSTMATTLELQVNFPECWDGRHLDSRDHKSHMAYAVDGRCPPSHPVPLPAISLVYHYPANLLSGASHVILSSGGQHSGHADFINSWNERALSELVKTCLNARAYCAAG